MNDYIKDMRKHIGHERLLTVGAGVIIYKDNQLLLQKRKDDGTWAVHGGAVELGEKVEDAARRELFEETGLVAHTLKFLDVFSGQEMFHTYPNGDKVAMVCIEYLCGDFSGELLLETAETTELKWFPVDSLPDNIAPTNVPMLKRAVEVLRSE